VPLEAGGDLDTLERLAERKEVRRLSQDRDGLRLLWEVASVPDFRNSLPEAHVNLLSQVFTQLRGPRGALDPDWVRSRIEQLDRLDGELEHLMTRIAWIRTWTYITHRSHWLTDAEAWAARARLVEDRLSDALHNQLTARFVNQRVVAIGREREQTGGLQIEVDAAGEVGAPRELAGLGEAAAAREAVFGDPAHEQRIPMAGDLERIVAGERTAGGPEHGHDLVDGRAVLVAPDAEGRSLLRGGRLAAERGGRDGRGERSVDAHDGQRGTARGSRGGDDGLGGGHGMA
jgi:hypothetical protein